jgi:thiol:disulfide interchange protein
MHANVIDIKTPADWDAKVLKNPKPVIVDFYADWYL